MQENALQIQRALPDPENSMVQDTAFETQLSFKVPPCPVAHRDCAAVTGFSPTETENLLNKNMESGGWTTAHQTNYFSYTKCPRRFCCQHASFSSVQKGRSLP
jgi:hypothetical protein